MAQTINIVGMTNTYHVTEHWEGHNCDFTVTKVIGEKHDLYGYSGTTRTPVCIRLSSYEGQCGSGWCASSWANLDIEEVDHFPPFSFVPSTPNKQFQITINPEEDFIKCEAFEFSSYGYDEYYPAGYYFLNFDVFQKTPRYSDKRVVFVFCGESGVGKSYLTGMMRNVKVYETDSKETLPDVIYEDVVVIGNKYDYSIDDIKSRLFENPTVRVCTIE